MENLKRKKEVFKARLQRLFSDADVHVVSIPVGIFTIEENSINKVEAIRHRLVGPDK